MNTSMAGYKTVSEAAKAWGVTVRYVNMCISGGRVSGAVKMGNMWLIPKGAEKPVGRRAMNARKHGDLSSDLAYVLAATNIPAPLDDPDAIIDQVEDQRLRIIPDIGLAYARGDFERVRRSFQQIGGDDAVKLCACSVAVPSAISTGDYSLFLELETYLKGLIQANVGAAVTAYAQLILAIGHLGAGAPDMAPGWLKDGDFSALPPPAVMSAAYTRVQYFRWHGNAELTLALAQTLLPFCAPELTFEGTTLRLLSAAAYCTLGRPDDAKSLLQSTLRMNLPHGFITPFASLIPLFNGLLERLLEQEFPAHHDAVVTLWKRTFANWLSFHNHFTKDNVSLILTLREYEIARLAAQRVPYAKIAELQCISLSRLKGIMDVIHGKLYVKNREELARYIL